MIFKRNLGARGQIVIPKDIRDHLGLEAGGEVVFEVQEGRVFITGSGDPVEFLEDFLNVPKLKKKLTPRQLKKLIRGQYEEELS